MQKQELRQIIREEISKVIKKEKEYIENPSDYMQVAQDVLKKKVFTLITPETTIEKGDYVLGKYNGLFGNIVRITGDNYFITYDIDDAEDPPIKRVRKSLEKNFLVSVEK
jgi:spore coat polysaccharide biosynthesis protein SpsF (cytidylyltransferase family)